MFRDVMLCSLVDRYHCFGGISCLHINGKAEQVELGASSITKEPTNQDKKQHIPDDWSQFVNDTGVSYA
jgi:hypothetical protein